MKHCGTQTIETERLLLRRFSKNDAGAMYRNWASDPEVTKYLTWPAHTSVNVSRAVLETRSLRGKCLTNPRRGIPFRRKNGSRWRTSTGRSSLSVRRMTCCGTPANTFAGWRSGLAVCVITAPLNAGFTNTEHTLPFPNPCSG